MPKIIRYLILLTILFSSPASARFPQNVANSYMPSYSIQKLIENLNKLPLTNTGGNGRYLHVFSSLNCNFSAMYIKSILSGKFNFDARFILVDATTDTEASAMYYTYKYRNAKAFLTALHGDPNLILRPSRDIAAIKSLSLTLSAITEMYTANSNLDRLSPLSIVYTQNGKIGPVVGIPNLEAVSRDIGDLSSIGDELDIKDDIDSIINSLDSFTLNSGQINLKVRTPLYVWPSPNSPYLLESPSNLNMPISGEKIINGQLWLRVSPFKNKSVYFYVKN